MDRYVLLHSIAPDRPWVTYFAPGTAHAPHHAPKDWIAKFKGQFDQGWDKVREESLARQKKLGVVPQDTKLTKRSAGIPAWNSLDADHKRPAFSLGLCIFRFQSAYRDGLGGAPIGPAIIGARRSNRVELLVFEVETNRPQRPAYPIPVGGRPKAANRLAPSGGA